MRRLLHVLMALWVALSLLAPAGAQEPPAPYFSLASDRTFSPGQKPIVNLWAHNVGTLEFRVYRVRDPEQFFAQLQDLHNFGGRAPQVPHTETWIERFHHWKQHIWAMIRDFVRAQFSADTREKIRDWMAGRRKQPIKPVEIYAQVPLLNRQQVVAVWRETLNPEARRWEAQTVPIPVSDPGVYLVEATNGQLRAYTIVMIDRMAVVTKSAQGRMLVFVADRKTGVPIAACTVSVFVGKDKPLTAETDENGLADLKIAQPKPERVVVLAKKGDDFAVAAPFGNSLSIDPEQSATAYIYTDRPVYRPGDVVHYKAVLRTQVHGRYELLPKPDVELDIRDPEYKVIVQKAVTASDMGTVKGEFPVPAGAALGNYTLEIGPGEARATGTFYVEEYKKPEYEVRVTAAARRVLQGQPIQATIDARYYFGEPVAGAKVTWVVHQARYWSWPYLQDEADEAGSDEGESGGEGDDGEGYAGEQTQEQTGKLDADGKLQITLPTAVSDKKWDTQYRVEARVTDASNREISGHSFVVATYGSFRIDARPGSYVYAPGETAKFAVTASDYDNKPIQTAFRVVMTPTARDRQNVILFSGGGTTDASGKAEVSIPVRVAGSFLVKVAARTPESRDVEGESWLWVPGNAGVWQRASEQIRIVPDKASYKPGDTAKVLIITGGPAHVLVTAQGNDLYSYRLVATTGSTATVEIPILPEFAPNFYVRAAFLRADKLFEGTRSLRVPPDEHEIKVELKPSKPQYLPGEPASYSIAAHDSQGRPVAGEFSLGVVDEAIYAIHPEMAQDILKFFYGRVWDRVATESSLSYYFNGEAGKRSMQLSALERPRALGQIKPERLVAPKVRKAFPDTAYWVADVRTDAGGHAQVKFNYPDALTTWRATTRGVTRDTKVGGAVEKVLVRKNVIVRLAVPRFFRQGDEVTVAALVHNYLPDAKTARVSLELSGLDVVKGSTQDVQVPSRGDAKVEWRVKAPVIGDARLLAKALTDVESDALEITLPVLPYGVKQAIARAGSMGDGGGEHQETFTYPPPSDPASRSLQLSVTPSIAGAIFGALDFLTSYPYGCTEQTMSSFLPNVIVAQATKELGLKSGGTPDELPRKIRAGLDRLYDFQHPDGGWGWWQTDDSQVFMTAYVLAGLSQARTAQYDVKAESIANARTWLAGEFDRDTRIVPDLRAYIVYALVLAGDREPARSNAVWEQRGDLSPYGAAILGLALREAGDNRAQQLAEQLERSAQVEGDTAHWDLARDPLMGYEADSSAQTTAYALKLLAAAKPDSALLPKAAVWLVAHRDQGYWWNSTEQTAMVVYGLTDYLKRSGELKPDFSVSVEVNGKEVLARHFTAADALATSDASITLAPIQVSASNSVVVKKTGTGTLYWSGRAQYFSDDKKLVNSGALSLTLAREYYKLTPTQAQDKIVYTMDRLAGPVAPGDILAVRLTVSGGDWRYLMVEDPIPAGAEFIQNDDLYELRDGRPPAWTSWYTRREFHDDRATFFQTFFSRGQHEFVYLLKVVNPGVFRVSPGRVEPMYQPGRLATSDAQTVIVQ